MLVEVRFTCLNPPFACFSPTIPSWTFIFAACEGVSLVSTRKESVVIVLRCGRVRSRAEDKHVKGLKWMARWSCRLWRVFSPGWETGSGSAWSLSFWPRLSLWLYTWCCIFPTNLLLGKHLSVMWIQRKLMGFYVGCCLWKTGRVSGDKPGLGASMKKLVDHRLVCNSAIYVSLYIYC